VEGDRDSRDHDSLIRRDHHSLIRFDLTDFFWRVRGGLPI